MQTSSTFLCCQFTCDEVLPWVTSRSCLPNWFIEVAVSPSPFINQSLLSGRLWGSVENNTAAVWSLGASCVSGLTLILRKSGSRKIH